ncbi:MAG: hypothetical protein CUN48_16225, partial [Candidatus Thermofonsia Clade 3 bacterium]
YALDDNKFYVRDEAETSLAVRDEIVALVREGLGFEPEQEEPVASPAKAASAKPAEKEGRQPQRERKNGATVRSPASLPAAQVNGAQTPPQQTPTPGEDTTFYLPQVGVEIVESEERNGHRCYTIRDLRNGHVIKNVTRKGARKLWSYAIQQVEDKPVDPSRIEWRGNLGFIRMERRAGKARYDL